MEEIDIIELLQRVKENKAPKEIEINNHKYIYNDKEFNYVEWMYYRYIGTNKRYWIGDETIKLNTKIKILDKPIIEELPDICKPDYISDDWYRFNIVETNREKINEIIDYINNKENKDE